MAIIIKKTLHPTDPVVNQNHAAVLDAFQQANAVLAAQAINGTVGNRITDASVAAGRALVGTGSAFPVPAATNQLWFRTDRGILYYYDGTRWLSQQEYSVPLTAYSFFPSAGTANGTIGLGIVPHDFGGGLYLTRLKTWTNTVAPNGGGIFWTFNFLNSAGTNLGTFNTNADTAATDSEHDLDTINSVRVRATDKYWFLSIVKTGLPGQVALLGASALCRLIG